MPRTRLAAAAPDGLIHAVGGFDPGGSGFLPTDVPFDPLTETRASLAPMLQSRGSLSAVGLEGELRAVGGAPVS